MHTAPRVFNLGDRCSSVPLISLGKPLVPSTQGPFTSDVDDENLCPRPVSNSGHPARSHSFTDCYVSSTSCHTNRCPWQKADYTEILQRVRTAFKGILECKFTFGHGHTFEQNWWKDMSTWRDPLPKVIHTATRTTVWFTLVEAPRYKPEGCGFDSRWSQWNFSTRHNISFTRN